MNRRFPWRAAAALLCALLLPAVSLIFDRAALPDSPRDPDTCLGVPILKQDQPISEKAEPPLVLYQGKAAPLDEKSLTLYLTVSASTGAKACDLTGTLTAADNGVQLAFAPDPAFEDLFAAMAQGHSFRLLALREDGSFSEFSVVFTSLPVICMDTTDDSDYGDPYAEHVGNVRVFEANSASTAQADWHRRGMSTRLFKKGSWKLSITNVFGHPSNLAIAGLGSDDDWMLNSMGMDDLKLREMLVTRLWNEMQQEKGTALRMADCAYAEVILDGEYMGLYLLQRRVDAKYLGLEKSRDILLKGGNFDSPKDATESFTVKSSPFGEQETQMLAQPLFELSDVSNIALDAWIDMDSFILYGALYDNCLIRNTYFLLRPQLHSYEISVLPWDTDISFGLGYITGQGHTLLPVERESLPLTHRREYDALRNLYPDLDERIASRCRSLRSSVLSDANVDEMLSAITQELNQSGAYARDTALWGMRYGGEDTVERLRRFIQLRFEQVDAVYTEQ